MHQSAKSSGTVRISVRTLQPCTLELAPGYSQSFSAGIVISVALNRATPWIEQGLVERVQQQ